jgi:hypothetical protein
MLGVIRGRPFVLCNEECKMQVWCMQELGDGLNEIMLSAVALLDVHRLMIFLLARPELIHTHTSWAQLLICATS